MVLFFQILGSILGGIFLLLLLVWAVIHFIGSIGIRPFDVTAWTIEPTVPVKMEPQPDGNCKVSWQTQAELTEIRKGTDPENIRKPVAYTKVSEQDVIIHDVDRKQRIYLELIFSDHPKLIVAERFIPLEHAYNFRDLGGYQTQDGKQVRWGKIFRTDALDQLTDNEQSYLTAMGLRLVCDLRHEEECEKHPDLLPAAVQHLHLPVNTEDWMGEIWPILFFQRRKMGTMMEDSYSRMLRKFPKNFAAVLTRFADEENLPAAFHCTAGKDRAGLTAALLLSLLNVPDETIIADYSISNYSYEERITKFREDMRNYFRRMGIPFKDTHIFNAANPAWMASALHYIHGEYGTTENYLIQAAGMEKSTLEAIRKNLLEG